MPHLNNKQNKNTNSSADRITTSLSLAYQRKNKQTKTQHKSHPIPSLHKPLDQPQGGRNKKKKEFNLEAWGKETSNIISLKKNEKAEKYYINEGTKQKHRSPNK